MCPWIVHPVDKCATLIGATMDVHHLCEAHQLSCHLGRTHELQIWLWNALVISTTGALGLIALSDVIFVTKKYATAFFRQQNYAKNAQFATFANFQQKCVNWDLTNEKLLFFFQHLYRILRSADVLSGRHFVSIALDVLSGRHFVWAILCIIFFQADWLRRFARKSFVRTEILGDYLNNMFALLGQYLGTTWELLGHYLNNTSALDHL